VLGVPRESLPVYRDTLLAIVSTSLSGSGGLQRILFSSCSAAKMDASDIPRRRIEPARDVKEALRWPSGMFPSVDGASSLIPPFPWEEISLNSSTGSLGSSPLIGTSHL
jgi:hypothetical protein